MEQQTEQRAERVSRCGLSELVLDYHYPPELQRRLWLEEGTHAAGARVKLPVSELTPTSRGHLDVALVDDSGGYAMPREILTEVPQLEAYSSPDYKVASEHAGSVHVAVEWTDVDHEPDRADAGAHAAGALAAAAALAPRIHEAWCAEQERREAAKREEAQRKLDELATRPPEWWLHFGHVVEKRWHAHGLPERTAELAELDPRIAAVLLEAAALGRVVRAYRRFFEEIADAAEGALLASETDWVAAQTDDATKRARECIALGQGYQRALRRAVLDRIGAPEAVPDPDDSEWGDRDSPSAGALELLAVVRAGVQSAELPPGWEIDEVDVARVTWEEETGEEFRRTAVVLTMHTLRGLYRYVIWTE